MSSQDLHRQVSHHCITILPRGRGTISSEVVSLLGHVYYRTILKASIRHLTIRHSHVLFRRCVCYTVLDKGAWVWPTVFPWSQLVRDEEEVFHFLNIWNKWCRWLTLVPWTLQLKAFSFKFLLKLIHHYFLLIYLVRT